MSDDQTEKPRRPRMADPRDEDQPGFGAGQIGAEAARPLLPTPRGDLQVQTFDSVITAQRVAVPRNEKLVRQRLGALCAMNGERYLYSWQAQDRANRRETTIEGPTIKLANDLVRTYGNCVVDVREMDTGSHWTFYARFVDLETGFSMTRPFRQRKGQDTGMRDVDRASDIVYQIGCSKAIRNVVVNALSTLADFMVEESQNSLIAWIEQHGDKAQNYIDKITREYNVAIARIEAVVGRARKDWTVRDVARVMKELRGLEEGLSNAAELYPSDEDAREVTAEKQENKAAIKPEPKKEEPKAEPAKESPSANDASGVRGGDANRATTARRGPGDDLLSGSI